MKARSIVTVCLVGAAAVACGPREAGPSSDGHWVGTISTAGGVTTVINESGSVWSGRGELIEEAAIGVEVGPEEYMFGDLFAVQVTDEHIYVTDEQVDRVRRFDLDGVFVDNVGAIGQGPGEYGDPAMVAVADDGRIIVFDYAARRMQVYDARGTPLDNWPAPHASCCGWPMLTDTDGSLWVATTEGDQETGEASYAIQVLGPDGATEPHYAVKEVPLPDATLTVAATVRISMPFAPQFVWTLAAPGRVIAGAAASYRFEIQERGETVRVVQKYWEPVPIDAGYRDWRRTTMIALGRPFDPGWTWSGAEMPTHYPAYGSLIADRSGGTWVARFDGSVRTEECADPLAEAEPAWAPGEACWQETFVLDVFDDEGRFLGEVTTPPGVRPHPLRMLVDGDRVVAVCVDERGVYQVKRYRLERPGDR